MKLNLLNLFYLLQLILVTKENEGPLQYPEPPEGWDEGDCQSLQIQSPINIPFLKDESIVIDNGNYSNIILLNYSIINSGKVKFDNGHKWTTEELDIGNIEIELNKTIYKYKLHSIHFHLYSEHRIENTQYPMEMHMVHKNMNKTDIENQNLVIGVLFSFKNDIENKFLNDMSLADENEIKDASITSLINEKNSYYYYKGSLTTTPCTENVNWIVFRDIKDMSFNQFNKFQNWVEKSNMKYYGVGYGNARGPKRLSGRKIYLENSNYSDKGYLGIIIIFVFIIIIVLFFFFMKGKSL